MMKKDQFLKLLSKKLSGDISNAENEILDRALKSNEEYKSLAAEISNYFHHRKTEGPQADRLKNVWEIIAKTEHEDLQGRFNYSAPKTTTFSYASVFKIAAVLCVLISVSIVGYQLLNRNSKQAFDNLTTTNNKSFKVLDDGTKIWLNKKSSISFNKAFGKDKREIFLKGEAYFDVVKNAAIPLFIHAGNIDIEVKGTAFNVNAYNEDQEIQVALIRGSIQVTNRLNKHNKVLLKPNEKLIYANYHLEKDNGFLVIPMGSKLVSGVAKWTSDTLVFQKERLKDLVKRMEKKYSVKIEIQSDKLEEKRFSGTFTDETIQQALEALKLSYPLVYTINDRLIIIRDKP
jgi:transmembrane sensor